VVIIPTYNEIESLPRQMEGVLTCVPHAHVLVVDDASPDGTGQWAEKFAVTDERVHVLHRTAKQGLGAAYLAGFAWALERDYDVIVEMDADGSHQASQLPDVLAAAGEWDLAIGSRWVVGGSVRNWPKHREMLSRGANTYVRTMLGVPVHDATAGFRAFKREMLASLDLAGVQSQGYCFQVDLTWRVIKAGGRVVEVPIEFVERDAGASKMTGAIIREALVKVTQWGLAHRWRQVTKRR
jgi:dolichol-phosphate mannosyltransferase